MNKNNKFNAGNNYVLREVFPTFTRIELMATVGRINDCVALHKANEDLEGDNAKTLYHILHHYNIHNLSADDLAKELAEHLKDGDTNLDRCILTIKSKYANDDDDDDDEKENEEWVNDDKDCSTGSIRWIERSNRRKPVSLMDSVKNGIAKAMAAKEKLFYADKGNPVNKDSNIDDVDNPPFLTPTPDKDPMNAIRNKEGKPQRVPSLNPKLPKEQLDQHKGEDDDDTLTDGENLILYGDKIKYELSDSILEKFQKTLERKYEEDTKVKMGSMDTEEGIEPDKTVSPSPVQDRGSKLVPDKTGHDKKNLSDRQEPGNDCQPLPSEIPASVSKEVEKYKGIASKAIAIAEQLQAKLNDDIAYTNELAKNPTMRDELKRVADTYNSDPDMKNTIARYGKPYGTT